MTTMISAALRDIQAYEYQLFGGVVLVVSTRDTDRDLRQNSRYARLIVRGRYAGWPDLESGSGSNPFAN